MVIKGTDLQVSQSGFRCVYLSITLDEQRVGIRTVNSSAMVLLVNVQNNIYVKHALSFNHKKPKLEKQLKKRLSVASCCYIKTTTLSV